MIPLTRRTLLAGAAAVPALGLTGGLAACGREEEPAAAEGPPDQVTYLTSFGTFGRDAYAYVADKKGYFQDAGIEVDIQPGTGTPNLAQVAGGGAQFAAADLSGAIITRGEGNAGFVGLAAIHQQTPAALMTVEPDIRSPHDLAGRTVFMASGAVLELLFPTYASLAGFEADEVDVVPVEPANLIPALSGDDADAIEQFAMGVPTVSAATGQEDITVLPYSDVLRDLYGVVLFAHSELVEQDPDLVQRFTRALLRGLEDAIADPEGAGQILAERVPEVDPAVAAEELVLMEPYIQPLDAAAPLGSIDDQRVSKNIAILESAGAIQEGQTPEDLVSFELTPGSESS